VRPSTRDALLERVAVAKRETDHTAAVFGTAIGRRTPCEAIASAVHIVEAFIEREQIEILNVPG
jgi:hypothetical protein